MVALAKKYQDALPRIKENVRMAYDYFRPNYDRFNEFKKFAFVSTLSDDDIAVLKTLMKPQLEFNVLEAYISRLRGEFSKQEPAVEVSQDHDMPLEPEVVEVVEGYLRHAFSEANKNGCEYTVYTDLLAGGFSAFKVSTDYVSQMSFNQEIKFERVYDPTLCGFDPLARLPHKADGRFCFELFPKTKEEFKEEYPDIDISQVKFSKTLEGFNFSYSTQKEDIILVIDYYEKKNVKTKIVKLSDGKTMTQDAYDDFYIEWQDSGQIEQAPAIVDTRSTMIEKICRYRFIENQVLEYVETDFNQLPLVFVDGNSVYVRESREGELKQFTRPYIYNAKGVQKLKNFAGQSLANELENSVQHKISVPKEGIPNGLEEAFENIQIPKALVYNAFKNNDPNIPLPPPQMIARTPIPPEFTNTFMASDQTIQGILGSYDASLGINNNQLSGIAIVEGATQSNAAAMPYVVGFMQGLNQVAQIMVDLIPKFYVTPRTIPIKKPDGQKSYVEVNHKQGVQLNYPADALNVNVEAGVSFSVQKTRALQQITALMKASPLFAQFMNTEGLPVLLDNLEIRGIDQLKGMTEEYLNEMKQKQEQAKKQPNPDTMKLQLEQAKLAQNAKQDQVSNQIKVGQLAVDKQKDDTERLKAMATMQESRENRLVQMEKSQTERIGKAVEYAAKAADMSHQHNKDVYNLAKEVRDNKGKD